MAGCADKSVIKYNSFIVGTRQSLPPITGLVWEVKTDNGTKDSDTTDDTHTNMHHKDNQYRWGGKTALGRDPEGY
jgi:hypothetical protein